MKGHILGYQTCKSIHHQTITDYAVSAGLAKIFYYSFGDDKSPFFIIFIWKRKQLALMLVERDSIVDLYFDVFAHVKQLDPIFTWLCQLRDTILLWVNLLPHCLASIDIYKVSLLDHLKLWTDPDGRLRHEFFSYYVWHLDITDLNGSFFFRLLFLGGFLFIFCCFFCLFCLLF